MCRSLCDGRVCAVLVIISLVGMKREFCCLGDQVFLLLSPHLKF